MVMWMNKDPDPSGENVMAWMSEDQKGSSTMEAVFGGLHSDQHRPLYEVVARLDPSPKTYR